LEINGKKIKSKGSPAYKVDGDKVGIIRNMIENDQKILWGIMLVPTSFLVSLISQFDAFIGNLIRIIFLILPDALNTSEKNISFSELSEFSSLREAREHIIEKEVETVLRDSHADHFKWFESKFKIKIKEHLDNWIDFIEITERRNLFVHNNGRISKSYLENCRRHKIKINKSFKAGVTIGVNPDYFDKAFKCIFEIGIKLAHISWRKIRQTDLLEADKNLSRICYDLIKDEKYQLAARLLDFAHSPLIRHADDEMRRIFIINRAQVYKWQGKEKEAVKIINEQDWSSTKDIFKLAVAVIKDEFKNANALIKRIGDSKELSKNDYREWPLFKKLRKEISFQETFKEIFNEDFNIVKPEDVDQKLIEEKNSSLRD
jgi:hypothetical protein